MTVQTTLRVCEKCEGLFVLVHWRTKLCPACSEAEGPTITKPEGMVACVYYISNVDRDTVYVGVTGSLERRLQDHKRKGWWEWIDVITCEWFPTRGAAETAEARAIRDHDPLYNKQHSRSNNITRVCAACDGRFYPDNNKQDYCWGCFRWRR